jgi:hypothetical protein
LSTLPPTIAYVCLENDTQTLAAALALHQATSEASFDIVACVMDDSAVGELLGAVPSRDSLGSVWSFDRLVGFPVLDRVCTADVILGSLARRVHEDYVERALERGEELRERPSLVPWEDLSEEYREANRRQVDGYQQALAAVECVIVPEDGWEPAPFSFTTAELEILSRAEHDRWMQNKQREGWKRGPRDEASGTHPDLVDWDALPEDAREKDRDVFRNLPRLMAGVGLRLHRRGGDP